MTATSGLGALADWLNAHGIATVPRPDGLVIDDGEVRLDVAHDDAWRVSKTWRDDDRGAQFAGPDLESVDRYVTLLYLNSIRSQHGLRRLRSAVTLDDAGRVTAPEGFRLSGDLDGGFELEEPGAPALWFASDIEAARYAAHASQTPEALRRLGDHDA